MDYTFERDKKLGNSPWINIKNSKGETEKICIDCLSYQAEMHFEYPDRAQDEFEDLDDLTDEYNLYVQLIQSGAYPVDGNFAYRYHKMFPDDEVVKGIRRATKNLSKEK